MTSQGSLRAFRWPCWIGFVLLPATVYAGDGMYCGDENCYTVLGLERASFDATMLKKTYRKMSMQWHPDKNPDNKDEATAKFTVIRTAFETLDSPDIKDAYDYYLDHPEMTMYNKMNFYRAAYKPTTPLWTVFVGFVLVLSLLQYFNNGENAKAFLKSPIFLKLVEDEYFANCTRGRHGYQTGELTTERKKEIKAAFIVTLTDDADCPLHWARWSRVLLPNMVYWWPLKLVAYIKYRIENKDEIQEEADRIAKEEAEAEEEERVVREEREQREAEHDKKKGENAERLAVKQAQEAAKKQKWADEAAKEAEAKEEQESKRSLIVEGKAVAVSDMKKKGHFLVEVSYQEDGEEQRAQIVVVDKEVPEGARVKIALEGADVKGRIVKRTKVAGEFSEGELLEILAAGAEEPSGDAAPAADATQEEGVKERKKKTKGKAES